MVLAAYIKVLRVVASTRVETYSLAAAEYARKTKVQLYNQA